MIKIYLLKAKLYAVLMLFAAGIAFGGIRDLKSSAALEDACNWTVIVENPFYFGDEVSWELRSSNGTILLSGGGYDDLGFYDEQTVSATGPLEFYVSTMGEYGDNKLYYSVANDNGVIISGILPGSSERTFSNLNCSDPAQVEPDLSCAEQFTTSNEVQSAFIFGDEDNIRLAVDIPVGVSGFTVFGINMNLIIDGDPNIFIDFTLYDDDNGKPGNVIGGAGGEIMETDYIDQAFGLDLYRMVVKFSEPFDLQPNTRYWIEVTAEADSWQSVDLETIGKGLSVNASFTGDEWVTDPTSEFVYELVCSQMETHEFGEDDFGYYPNPVNERLNIVSKNQLKKFEVYDLTGRILISGTKTVKESIDMSSLKPGTYLFKLVFENGKTESFKIVKK